MRIDDAPGALAIERLAFHLIGGNAQITAAVNNTPSSAAIQFDAALNGAETGQLSGLLGVGSMPFAGVVDAHAIPRLTGNTPEEAARVTAGPSFCRYRAGPFSER